MNNTIFSTMVKTLLTKSYTKYTQKVINELKKYEGKYKNTNEYIEKMVKSKGANFRDDSIQPRLKYLKVVKYGENAHRINIELGYDDSYAIIDDENKERNKEGESVANRIRTEFIEDTPNFTLLETTLREYINIILNKTEESYYELKYNTDTRKIIHLGISDDWYYKYRFLDIQIKSNSIDIEEVKCKYHSTFDRTKLHKGKKIPKQEIADLIVNKYSELKEMFNAEV